MSIEGVTVQAKDALISLILTHKDASHQHKNQPPGTQDLHQQCHLNSNNRKSDAVGLHRPEKLFIEPFKTGGDFV